jgi:chromosome segregation ATPase
VDLAHDRTARTEALRLARYGEPPQSFFAAIPYAIHVFNRWRELKAELSEKDRVREGAKKAADASLTALGRALLELGDGLGPQVSDALELARRCATDAEARSASSAEAQEQQKAEIASYDARIEAQRREVDPWRDRETKLVTQLGVRDSDLKRALAKLQRAQIELRNLRGTLADENAVADPSRVAALEADVAARQGEVELAQGPVRELNEQLVEVRRGLAASMAEVTRLESEKRQVSQALRDAESTRQVQVSAAQGELEAALRTLADRAREVGAASAAPEAAARADKALALLAERHRLAELHRLALHVYDKGAVTRGAAVLASAAVVILIMLVLIVAT